MPVSSMQQKHNPLKTLSLFLFQKHTDFPMAATDLLLLLCNEETKIVPLDDAKLMIKSPDSEAPPFLSDECIAFLLEKQSEHLPRFDYLDRLRTGDLDVELRKEALDWMFKTCDYFSFGELCLYTAISYFDRFLSDYDFFPVSTDTARKNWQIQLVAVGCLSLAAKMEEVQVPSLEDLQEGASKYVFVGKTVQKMEILVLKRLQWKIKAYTPCDFIEYYLRKLNDNNKLASGKVMARSLRVILSTFEGIEFLEFKPSEIAAAVAMYVSRAMDIDKALSCLIGVEKERVVKCLEMFQELSPMDVTIAIATSETTSSRAISFPTSPNGVLEAASLNYTSKRDSTCSDISPESKRRKLDQTPAVGGGDS